MIKQLTGSLWDLDAADHEAYVEFLEKKKAANEDDDPLNDMDDRDDEEYLFEEVFKIRSYKEKDRAMGTGPFRFG